MSKFYFRTTVSIDVLSEEPIGDLDLDSIQYGITNGNLVGGPVNHEQKSLSPQEMAAALFDFGSEPGFFGMDDKGERLEFPDERRHASDTAGEDGESHYA